MLGYPTCAWADRVWDADGDGFVNAADAAILAGNWLKGVGNGASGGDFNVDGTVDDLDLAILAANWSPGTGGAAVPEPGTMALLLLGAVGTYAIRRRGRQE
ncbi:MAG: PEP-CTERM sorting domain-containing protein [Pirellulales bacterium]|nr:PEP-CTERM sorting domain-containing protein [Pirellulales bacterium]